jgi:hypothetical protein
MPLRWEIDHDRQFVHIVVEDGPLVLKDMEEHFDALAVANAMGYAKLFDATRFQPVYSDQDVMAIGARLSAYTATLASGPLAVVGTDPALEVAFRRFINVSPATRPTKLFGSEAKARVWLEQQAPTRMTPPQAQKTPRKKQPHHWKKP